MPGSAAVFTVGFYLSGGVKNSRLPFNTLTDKQSVASRSRSSHFCSHFSAFLFRFHAKQLMLMRTSVKLQAPLDHLHPWKLNHNRNITQLSSYFHAPRQKAYILTSAVQLFWSQASLTANILHVCSWTVFSVTGLVLHRWLSVVQSLPCML